MSIKAEHKELKVDKKVKITERKKLTGKFRVPKFLLQRSALLQKYDKIQDTRQLFKADLIIFAPLTLLFITLVYCLFSGVADAQNKRNLESIYTINANIHSGCVEYKLVEEVVSKKLNELGYDPKTFDEGELVKVEVDKDNPKEPKKIYRDGELRYKGHTLQRLFMIVLTIMTILGDLYIIINIAEKDGIKIPFINSSKSSKEDDTDLDIFG